MTSGARAIRRAQVAGVLGALTVTVLVLMIAHALANGPTSPQPTSTRSTATSVLLGTAVFGLALLPLARPHPSRTPVLIARVARRAFVGSTILGTLALAGAPLALDFPAIAVVGIALSVCVPVWYWLVRRSLPRRAIVVGDDPVLIGEAIRAVPVEPVGYVSPILGVRGGGPIRPRDGDDADGSGQAISPDGGLVSSSSEGQSSSDDERSSERDRRTSTALSLAHVASTERLNGLSRLEHVLQRHCVDTAALAFREADREEFFGAMRTCHDNGVDVSVHSHHAGHVLADGTGDETLVDVALEPWPWYSRVAKRCFDVVFAALGLIVLAPIILAIAVAIKRDSPGPVLYTQERSTVGGRRFRVSKFRTMLPDSEVATPQDDEENDRITDVGRVLRRTHMDEIPQLLAILRGEMSAVGPRAAWVEEEELLQREIEGWPMRWFVKPGLTGLAQVNMASSKQGVEKLQYDLEYVKRRSFVYDLRIVVEQFRVVFAEVGTLSDRS